MSLKKVTSLDRKFQAKGHGQSQPAVNVIVTKAASPISMFFTLNNAREMHCDIIDQFTLSDSRGEPWDFAIEQRGSHYILSIPCQRIDENLETFVAIAEFAKPIGIKQWIKQVGIDFILDHLWRYMRISWINFSGSITVCGPLTPEMKERGQLEGEEEPFLV
jgi:hypothetical protein